MATKAHPLRRANVQKGYVRFFVLYPKNKSSSLSLSREPFVRIRFGFSPSTHVRRLHKIRAVKDQTVMRRTLAVVFLLCLGTNVLTTSTGYVVWVESNRLSSTNVHCVATYCLLASTSCLNVRFVACGNLSVAQYCRRSLR